MRIITGVLDKYLKDESNFQSINIESVFLPETPDEIAGIIKTGKGSPFTLYGGGTGIVAGVISSSGSIISTEKLKKIQVNAGKKYVDVQAGVLLKELHEEIKKHKLWFPVDSTEQTATLGGNIATNASGAGSFKYGNIRDFVDELKIITANGENLIIRRGQIKADGTKFYFKTGNDNIKFNIIDLSSYFTYKNSAGYYMKNNMDLIDLFIGSEGTLGVITEARIKLLPAPFDIKAFMIDFKSSKEAFDFIKSIKEHKKDLSPLSLEFIDEKSLGLIREKFDKISKFNTLVFVEIDAADEKDADMKLEKFYGFLQDRGISEDRVLVTNTKAKKNFIYELREAVPNAVNEYIRQKNLTKVSTDFAVDDSMSDKMLNIYEQMLKYVKIKHVVFGHAGNNNLHINFLPENEKEHGEALAIYEDMAKEIIKLKGTISAEHGIGKIKKKYLSEMYEVEVINKMKEIKKVFDPNSILNPGNIFD